MGTDRLRILVVDDDRELRTCFVDMLARHGYEVEAAADGLIGLSVFRHAMTPFEYVLTDYQMPRMNGLAMTEAILALAPETRIVMVTGAPPAANHVPAGVRVLQKPVRSADILAALQS